MKLNFGPLSLAIILLPAGPALALAAQADGPPPELFATPQRVTRAELDRLPPHPRLLATADRWGALRRQIVTDPASGELAAAILRSADALVSAEPVDYTPARPGEPIAANIGSASRRILALASAYRLTGEGRYAAAAHGGDGVRDTWADPRGSSLSLVEASKVWTLFGAAPAIKDNMPAVGETLMAGPLAYHLRDGVHDLTALDRQLYLDHADGLFRVPPPQK